MGSTEKMNEFVQKMSSKKSKDITPLNNLCIERIQLLLDKDSFVEVNQFVQSRGLSYGFSREKIDGDGVVTGYGTINDQLVFVASQDPSVYAGSLGQMHAEKIISVIQMAIRAKAPFIGVYDTGGARIEEGILSLEGLSGLLSSINEASKEIPTIAAVVGPCLGGSAFAASMSHFCFMTKEKSGIFMHGPMVTSATTGKTLNAADIGGAKVHSQITGLASVVCDDVDSCMSSIRKLISYLPEHPDDVAIDMESTDDPNRTEIKLDQIANNLDTGYDIKEIIRLITDKASVYELSSEYAKGMITSLAKVDGITIGIVANKEVRMDSAMAKKATSFIKICNSFQIPIISLVDCEGYKIGLEFEQSDMILRAGELYKAMDECVVPRVGILIGKSIGTAYLSLASKQSGCDIVYAWPTAEISVVTPDTAANIIYIKEIAASQDPIVARKEFTDKYSKEIASPFIASSLGHVDEIIMPSATRPRIISALQILLS